MSSPRDDLPEAANARLTGYSAYTSGLSVNDLAACEHMGLRPLGLVQGFCVMSWSFTYGASTWYYGSGRQTISSYSCPHPYYSTDSEHARYGANVECQDVEAAWGDGYNRAYHRMISEAKALGAHGVVGIKDTSHALLGSGVREFHLFGTAVAFEDSEPPKNIWSTYLAGQRLAKLFEAGLLPVTVIASIAAVCVYPVCVTEILERGSWDNWVNPGSEIEQLSDAYTSARQMARDNLKSRLGVDELHGAELAVNEIHHWGNEVVTAELRGTRVQRFRDMEPIPAPVPTVRLL